MPELNENKQNEEIVPASPKGTRGPKKVNKDEVIRNLSDSLFGPKDVPTLKISGEIKGDLIGQLERAFYVYTEACNLKGRKVDFSEFLSLAVEPGLKQVFKFSAADPHRAHENMKKFLGDSFGGRKKSSGPAGEPVE